MSRCDLQVKEEGNVKRARQEGAVRSSRFANRTMALIQSESEISEQSVLYVCHFISGKKYAGISLFVLESNSKQKRSS